MGPYSTIEDIKQKSKYSDEPWFLLPHILRDHRTRLGTIVYGGRFFITSERSLNGDRRYTVRYCTNEGLIKNASDFQQYRTWSQANYAAIQFARNQEAA